VRAADVVSAAVAAAPDALFVSSLGTATSALRLASDDGPHLYLGGAMGCGLATALGVADCRPGRDVIAVVGDGDLAMGASSLWTLSGLAPQNLLVLVLDDGAYSITGGQDVVGARAFRAVAGAFPGVAAAEADTPERVAEAVQTLARPAILLARVDERAWPGPSPFVNPHIVLTRFTQNAEGARIG
jgi:thiamine pyrophosphate-dependent acetolactate synthase large subunit-like protein